ncbi:MAG: hypothetical protein PVI23_07360 [Maricaulaceae bacterium]|jgi:hypothetical protein
MSDDHLIRPKPESSFFIGWSPQVPPVDRRAMLSAAIGLTALGAGAGWLLASRQDAPGSGTWDQADVRDFTGLFLTEPYPMLRTRDIDGSPRTALLACMTKCGVADRLPAFSNRPARVRGSVISRGRHAMITVSDGEDWIAEAEATDDSVLAPPSEQTLGEATLTGEILDSKCWFGAMRPADSKVHKACASLCIRSGIPPAFFARDDQGGEHALILTNPDGSGITPDGRFLSLVADPAQARGQLVARADQLQLRVDASSIVRL